MSQEKVQDKRDKLPPLPPSPKGLKITLEVVENIQLGNTGVTLTANPHAGEVFNKLKINVWTQEEGQEPKVSNVIEGQGRSWVVGQLVHQVQQAILNSQWARGF